MLRKIYSHLDQAIMEIVLVAICIYLKFNAPNFATFDNAVNILRAESLKGIMAFGMTMVIIAGEIDLSVASMVAFAGCLLGVMTEHGVPVLIGIVLTVIVGGLVGAFTGVLRTKFNVPTFISTLALYTGLRGAAQTLTKGFTINPFPDWFSANLDWVPIKIGGVTHSFSVPVFIFIAIFAAIHFLMNYTPFGRAVYAVGGNAEATRLSGINVAKVKIAVLALTAALAAFSGVLTSAKMNAGDPTVAFGWELDVIAAVIVGGTSLLGGAGKIWGTFIGVLFIGVIVNGMTLMNVPNYDQQMVRGALILFAVMLTQLQQRKN